MKQLGVDFVEFIELARSIRNKLGCRKYLLDWYLLNLLEMTYTFFPQDAAQDGSEASRNLRALVSQAMHQEKPDQPTRIGDTVNDYVSAHPLSLMEDDTKKRYIWQTCPNCI